MRGRWTFGGFDAFGGFTGFGSFGTAARGGCGNRACFTNLAASSAVDGTPAIEEPERLDAARSHADGDEAAERNLLQREARSNLPEQPNRRS